MEIFYNYIENMFTPLPKTTEIEGLKSELKLNMEEKYNELKNEGKSENEAIGIVIAEFGNIDEIVKEFGINENIKEEEHFIELTLDDANKFYNAKRFSSFIISIGVILCLLGTSLSISLTHLMDTGFIFLEISRTAKDFISVTVILMFIVIAVGLFIFAGVKMEKYKYIKQGLFSISSITRTIIKNEMKKNEKKMTIGLISGVCISILSPMPIFILNISSKTNGETYGISLLLILIALSVFLFINLSNINEGYKTILKEGEYAYKHQQEDKFIKSAASILWPIVVCIFLILGFLFNGWKIAWILFPISGILFSAFCGVYKSISESKKL